MTAELELEEKTLNKYGSGQKFLDLLIYTTITKVFEGMKAGNMDDYEFVRMFFIKDFDENGEPIMRDKKTVMEGFKCIILL